MRAQNLVPNPGFEEYHNCPVYSYNIAYSPHYDSFITVRSWVSPTWASPDYFNVCGAGSYQVPANSEGSQFPHQGNAYVGIIVYNGGGYSEYIECKLRKPMQAHHLYATSFYVSLGEFSQLATDQVAAHFSDTEFYQPFAPPLSLSKDVSSAPGIFIADTTGWVHVTDTFRANGGEQWMIVGKFADTVYHSKTVLPVGHAYSYLYIDDVSVVDTMLDTLRTDTLICAHTVPVKLKAASAGGLHYWTNGDTSSFIKVALPGEYTCVTRDTQVYVDNFEIRKVPHLFLGDDTLICRQSGQVPVGPLAVHGSQYVWSTGDTTADIYPAYTGAYMLTETNECGSSTDTINVEIANCDLNVGLPSAFSPNADGVNDILYVRGKAVQSIHLQIFNRAGLRLFDANDMEAGWNGMYNGAPMPADTYAYILSVTFTYGLSTTKTGSIVLLR